MTATELALALRVDQSMISRYESGKRLPRAPVLLRLLRLAEGVERNPILEQLAIIRGQPIFEEDALREAEAAEAEAAALLEELELLPDPRPNLARFAWLARTILRDQEEIDSSLNTFLELWLTPDLPQKTQCFGDAARFLEIALARAAETRSAAEAAGKKRSYRVVGPMNLGDGVRHKAGEIVKINRALAELYPDGLRLVDEDLAGPEEGKSA
jgi:transcriptional regulator with XRE-family HTH domain